MKILAVSYAYSPSIGGLETVTRTLCNSWKTLGHDVRIITHTPDPSGSHEEGVYRRPGPGILCDLHEWADVVWHNNITLTYARPAIHHRRRKPWFVTHGGEAFPRFWSRTRFIKHAVFYLARNISVSRYIAGTFGAKSVVIPNPYDSDLFQKMEGVPRDGDCVFLGRLVPDKGANLAIEICSLARDRKKPFRLAVIGSGPEETHLQGLVHTKGLTEWVTFKGALIGDALVRDLNRHKVMLVPSMWNEPFGVVALEGAACGLVVVGPTHGGLPDAIGPCGPLCPIADLKTWTDNVLLLLKERGERDRYLGLASGHLAKHSPAEIAERYLESFDQATRRNLA